MEGNINFWLVWICLYENPIFSFFTQLSKLFRGILIQPTSNNKEINFRLIDTLQQLSVRDCRTTISSIRKQYNPLWVILRDCFLEQFHGLINSLSDSRFPFWLKIKGVLYWRSKKQGVVAFFIQLKDYVDVFVKPNISNTIFIFHEIIEEPEKLTYCCIFVTVIKSFLWIQQTLSVLHPIWYLLWCSLSYSIRIIIILVALICRIIIIWISSRPYVFKLQITVIDFRIFSYPISTIFQAVPW